MAIKIWAIRLKYHGFKFNKAQSVKLFNSSIMCYELIKSFQFKSLQEFKKKFLNAKKKFLLFHGIVSSVIWAEKET